MTVIGKAERKGLIAGTDKAVVPGPGAYSLTGSFDAARQAYT
jgi:hypothetical protein